MANSSKKKLLWAYLLHLIKIECIEFKNIIEILALDYGSKKFVRLVIKPEKKKIIEDFIKTFNFYYKYAEHFLVDKINNSTMDTFQIRVKSVENENYSIPIYISKNKAIIETIKNIEEKDKFSDLEQNIFDFPECCTRNYVLSTEKEKINWIKNLLNNKHNYNRHSFYSNRFSSLASPNLSCHFDFFPCRLSCKKYNKQCKDNFEMLSSYVDKNFMKLLKQHLKAIVIEYKEHFWYFSFTRNIIKFEKKMSPLFLLGRKKYYKYFINNIKLYTKYVEVTINDQAINTQSDNLLKVRVFK